MKNYKEADLARIFHLYILKAFNFRHGIIWKSLQIQKEAFFLWVNNKSEEERLGCLRTQVEYKFG